MNTTTRPLRVLGISGSLRADSFNTAALRATAAPAGPAIGLHIWDGLGAVPPFCEDHEGPPAPAGDHLRTALGQADALLVATPEYSSSIPGQLKNALSTVR
ncbi:NAD(P)H-dependent oxidoreductase [Streptomyces noursei]|uniref:NAD(P)H-dependent oxidoreductase n=1 Tax=Streptomyces noursei TaxID=1971 RepID=UPI000C9C0BEB|nr:NAD(P)H-dependent oxidoreductase [Streptomyces noursei]